MKALLKSFKLLSCNHVKLEETVNQFIQEYPEFSFNLVYEMPEHLLTVSAPMEKQELLDQALGQIQERLKEEIFAEENISLPALLHSSLEHSGLTLSGAESCTGGLIAKILTDYPGSSKYFQYSIVSYSTSVKTQILNVPEETIAKKGVVSKATVVSMLDGLQYLYSTELGYALSGYAGPVGGEDYPVGTVFIGVMAHGQRDIRRYDFTGSRKEIRYYAAWTVFRRLLERLNQLKQY